MREREREKEGELELHIRLRLKHVEEPHEAVVRGTYIAWGGTL